MLRFFFVKLCLCVYCVLQSNVSTNGLQVENESERGGEEGWGSRQRIVSTYFVFEGQRDRDERAKKCRQKRNIETALTKSYVGKYLFFFFGI